MVIFQVVQVKKIVFEDPFMETIDLAGRGGKLKKKLSFIKYIKFFNKY